ncbi:HAD-IA family hydrolase [Actinoplanes sp. NPDC048967]|uniref:HAD family hydrolase n=1 Tax=Actinoplanes sp. NPDC048967 TaxID=3155269 RepID=UPI0033CB32A9
MAARGLLFDAGGVLIGPVGGRWNPRYDFEQVLARHVPAIPDSALPAAFAAGQALLDSASGTADRTDYHRAILQALGIADPTRELLAELEQPAAGLPVEPYPEVRDVLARLHADGVPMAVISDAWPDLDDLFRRLGLRNYFVTLVISAVLGCRKPDPRMYRAGSDALGLSPADCLFVDDDPELVAAAVRLGYQGVTMVRDPDGTAPPATRWIASLSELVP